MSWRADPPPPAPHGCAGLLMLVLIAEVLVAYLARTLAHH